MSDVLVRDLPEAVIAALDASAARLGLSRNEYVRRCLTQEAGRSGGPVTVKDLERFADLFDDLGDADIMGQAWQ